MRVHEPSGRGMRAVSPPCPMLLPAFVYSAFFEQLGKERLLAQAPGNRGICQTVSLFRSLSPLSPLASVLAFGVDLGCERCVRLVVFLLPWMAGQEFLGGGLWGNRPGNARARGGSPLSGRISFRARECADKTLSTLGAARIRFFFLLVTEEVFRGERSYISLEFQSPIYSFCAR